MSALTARKTFDAVTVAVPETKRYLRLVEMPVMTEQPALSHWDVAIKMSSYAINTHTQPERLTVYFATPPETAKQAAEQSGDIFSSYKNGLCFER